MPVSKQKKIDILSIGLCVVDALGRPVDKFPEKGKLAVFEKMELHVGGCAAATAITLAKMGAKTTLVGKIGADGLGDFFLNYTKESRADISHIARDKTHSTAFTFVAISSDGDRTFFHCPGADSTFSIEDVDMKLVRNARVVHIGGTFVMNTFDGEQTYRVLKAAKDAGAIISVDTAYNPSKNPDEVIGASLPLIDYFFAGYEEGVYITGKKNHRDIAFSLLDRGCKVAVVKRGERGSYVLSKDGGFDIAPFPATVVDTCGAGDVYVGGFLFGVVQGWKIEKCAKLGALLASYSISAIGGTAGVPKISDLGYIESLI
jgi:sugar/nucleoside kinase (ribokinase family)